MSAYLTLQCPSCGGRTRFSAGANRFVCDYCGNAHLFNLPGGAATADAVAAAAAPVSLPAPRPKQVSVERTPAGLRFSWRWFGPKYIALAVFCMAWDGFLCFWYSLALGMPGTPWIMVVFPVVHLAIGVAMTYSTLAGFINRTNVALEGGRLTVRHDPAPWPGEVDTPLGDLQQLYCKERRANSKNGPAYTYQLCAALKDGREIKLVSDLESPEIARYLEQEIERALHIEDRRVVGSI
jgi:ribosomal protein S27E